MYSQKIRVTFCTLIFNVKGLSVIYLFIYLIDTTLKLIIMGLPGEWKEHESFKERDMNVVE